jgi:cell shape-determining protein MreD
LILFSYVYFLCLILIISTSLVAEKRSNYFVSFAAGTILGILSGQNIGFWALVFLTVARSIHLIRRLPFSLTYLTVIPISLAAIFMVAFLEKLVFGQTINIVKVFIEATVTLPTYIFIKFWEERFIVRPEIRLKIKS